MRPATTEEAAADPLNHSIDDKGRVWHHPDPLSRGGYHKPTVEALPHPPAAGSAHVLRSPTGVQGQFAWRADLGPDGAWEPVDRMRRLAYTGDHLGSMGWSYLRPLASSGGETKDPEPVADPEPPGTETDAGDDLSAATPRSRKE